MRRNRFKILLIVVTLGTGVLMGRLAYLQIFDHRRYLKDAYGKRVRIEVTRAPRGAILDRNGRVLAQDKPAYDIAIIPGLICTHSPQAEAETIDILARAMHRTPREIRDRIYGPQGIRDRLAKDMQRHLRWLARRNMLKLSDEEAQELVDVVRMCETLAQARADIRARFGTGGLRIFDRQAAGDFVLEADVKPSVRDSVIIEAGDIRGVKVLSSSKRHYPFGESACHVLGYLGQLSQEEYRAKEEEGFFAGGLVEVIGPARYRTLERSNYFAVQPVGRTGVERALEGEMRPCPGARLVALTRDGRETLGRSDAQPGGNITLTIDIHLQKAAEDALAGLKGAVVVMDVHHGEILALASAPRYDLNTFRRPECYDLLRSDEDAPLVHRAVRGQYAPGSTFKILEAVAAVHEIEGFENVRYECHGRIRLGPNTVFHCRNHAPTGPMCLRDALKKSCNIFFYRTASRLGGARLRSWSERFGIGRHTGIEIGDAAGNLVQPRTEGEIANMAIGQGPLLMTPLQMARVVAAIANGGKLVTPHVLLYPEANLETVDLGLREDRLEPVRRGMWAVVNERGGTAYRHARMKRLEVAGKTGTAEIANSNLNNAWFVGFAPFDRPQVCIAVVIEKTAGHGGDTAGPVAREVLRAYFHED